MQRFYELLKYVDQFLVMSKKYFPEHKEPNWISKLAFLTDITHYLNQLNIELQGCDLLVNTAYQHIVTFEMKMKCWKKQINKKNCTFPITQTKSPS